MTRTSAVFNQAGVSIDKTSALLTGTNEVLQNIEKSSTGLITISQRLRGITEVGEDGAVATSKLAEEFKNIAGIDIFDEQSGQLRDTYSILADMAKVFPALTKNQRQYLGELAAGKRQINVLESLLSNWQGVEKALNAAKTSTGSATKENEKYLNSIEGKMKAVESAWQKLSQKTVDDNLVKGWYNFLKVLIDFQSTIGGLAPAIVAVVSLFSSKLIPVIAKASSVMFGFVKAIKTSQMTFSSWATVVGLSISAILAVVGAINSYNQAQSEMRQEQIQVAQTSADELENLNLLYSSYNKLYSTQNRTSEQESQLLSLSKQLEEAIGARAGKLKGLKAGTEEYNKALEEQIQKESSLKLADIATGISAAEKEFKAPSFGFTIGTSEVLNPNSVSATIKDVISKTMQEFESASSSFGYSTDMNIKFSANNIKEAVPYIEAARKAYDELNDRIALAAQDGNELYVTQVKNSDEYKSLSNILSEDGVLGSVKKWVELQAQQSVYFKIIGGEIPKTSAEFDVLKDSIVKSVGASGEFVEVVENIVNSALPQFSDEASSVTEYTSNYISKTSELSDKLATLKNEISSVKDTYKNLSDAMEEYNSSGSLSLETLESLMSLSPEYLQYLFDESGNINLNKQAIEELTQAKLEDLRVSLEAARSSEIADAREEANEQFFNLKQSTLENSEINEASTEIYSQLGDEIESINEKYDIQLSLIDKTTASLSELSESNTESLDTFNEVNSALDQAQSAYNTLSDAIDEYNETGILSFDTLQSILNLSPEYLSMLFDENNAINEKSIALNLASAAQYAQAEALKIAKIEELQAAAATDVYNYAMGNMAQVSPVAQSAISGIGRTAIVTGTQAVTAASYLDNFTNRVLADVAKMGGTVSAGKMSGVNSIIGAYKNLATSISGITAGMSGLSKATSGAGGAAKSASDDYGDLVKIVAKMIKQEVNDAIDALEEQLDAQKELHDEAVDSLKDQLSSYKDLIATKKDYLKQQKEEKTYQDDLAEKRKDVADIQSQLDELAFDSSESGAKKRLELEEEIAEKQKNLADLQYDHSISVQEDALEQEQGLYEEQIAAKIDALDKSYEATKQDYERRIEDLKNYLEKDGLIRTEAIELIEGRSADFYNRLFSWNAQYGDMTNAELSTLISNAGVAGSAMTSAMGSAGSAASDANKRFEALNSTLAQTAKYLSVIYGSGSDATYYNDPGAVTSSPYRMKSVTTTHHKGLDSGFVGGKLNGNEEFVKALRGEVYVTPYQQNKFMNNILPSMLKNASGSANVGSLLTINVSGNLDKSTLPDLKRVVNEQFRQLNKVLSSNGIIRTANSFQ